MIKFTQMRDLTGKEKDVIIVWSNLKVKQPESEFDVLLKTHVDLTGLDEDQRTKLFNIMNFTLNKSFTVDESETPKKESRPWYKLW